MTGQEHRYGLHLAWTGNTGPGTTFPAGYSRAHVLTAPGKPPIHGSSDPAFRGDPACWNPEEMLLASVAACHQLWYLGLCAQAGIVVTAYDDDPEGVMRENADGSGQFTGMTLRPRVVLASGADRDAAEALHETAHAMCFIARSVNFPVTCVPLVTGAPASPCEDPTDYA